MSSPDYIYVVYHEETEDFIKVRMDKRSVSELYDYLEPQVKIILPNSFNGFKYDYWAGVFSADDLLDANFPIFYRLILTACDELPSVAPFKNALKAAMENHLRYQEILVAIVKD